MAEFIFLQLMLENKNCFNLLKFWRIKFQAKNRLFKGLWLWRESEFDCELKIYQFFVISLHLKNGCQIFSWYKKGGPIFRDYFVLNSWHRMQSKYL